MAAALVTTCPVTGQELDTGIRMDAASFKVLPDSLMQVNCPHCRCDHVRRTCDARLVPPPLLLLRTPTMWP